MKLSDQTPRALVWLSFEDMFSTDGAAKRLLCMEAGSAISSKEKADGTAGAFKENYGKKMHIRLSLVKSYNLDSQLCCCWVS